MATSIKKATKKMEFGDLELSLRLGGREIFNASRGFNLLKEDLHFGLFSPFVVLLGQAKPLTYCKGDHS